MNILIIRFSSLGDVTLIRPVLTALHKKYPKVKITILSDKNFKNLFDFDNRIQFVGVDFKSKEGKILNLINEVNKLNKESKFDFIYDLHDVIRTKIIRNLFPSNITRVFDKGRNEKKELISKKIKIKKLKHTSVRYLDCLKRDFPLIHYKDLLSQIPPPKQPLPKTIGIAPFSKHQSKTWPLERYNEIIASFKDYNFIIFAFGNQERNLAKEKIKSGKLIEQNLNLNEQLDLMNKLSVMITMDSANMHLASLTNTNVISIWGSTHPCLGFGPLNNGEYVIKAFEDEELNRPLSVYGKVNKQDLKKSKERLEQVSSDKVIQTIEKALSD